MRPLGLYVHWPFCARICPYCDFTIAKVRQVDEAAWCAAFTDDLRRVADLCEPRPLTSVYFGGGTPSLIPERVAEAVLKEVEALFGFEDGFETTIEANPDDLDRFQPLQSMGFQRLSLGVQSLDDQELQFLGRNHDAETARRAIETSLETFERVSLDFIYALPDQSIDAWGKRLEEIVGLGAGHLSLYQLTIEPQTAFGRAAARGDLIQVPDDRGAAFYEVTQALTWAHGLPAYEVSNHAMPGQEARHNALYWGDADWIAIGPSAAGRFGDADHRWATEGIRQPAAYPHAPSSARITMERLNQQDHWLEILAGGLRPVAGLDAARLGVAASAVLAEAATLVGDGVLIIDGERIILTETGRLVTDHVAARLASVLPEPSSGAA